MSKITFHKFSARSDEQLGYASAVLAFTTWGLYPLFFKQLSRFGVIEILAHRILWSCVIFLVCLTLMSRLRGALRELYAPGRLREVVIATLLLTTNWFCFIYAVNTNRVLEASLGYFLIPVVNSIFGVVFFGENLNWLKIAATAVSFSGIVAVFIIAGIVPIISVTIALCFGAYGLMRKRSRLDSATGLFLETLVLCPFALGFILIAGTRIASLHAIDFTLLFCSGIITLVPLFAMVVAARRIEFNTLGFMQYITPIGHFLIAVLVYNEQISFGYGFAFATTWLAIALYLFGLTRPRAVKSPRRVASPR